MKIDFLSDINKDYAAALNYPQTDRFIVQVLWWHLGIFSVFVFLNAGLKLANLYPSPLAWRVITIPEAVGAMVLATLATLIPVLLVGKLQNHYLWRILITTGLTVYSYLFVFISGGSIEMHFHFFIVIALLVIYVDWRLGWILLVLTGLHHGILNYVEPGWVYFYGRNDLSVIAHSLPVLVAVICTSVLSEIGRHAVISLKDTEKELRAQNMDLQKSRDSLEHDAEGRGTELKIKVEELQKVNKILFEREAEIGGLKVELAALKKES